MSSLKDKTLFITGASRGIGKSIALRAAADGANVVVAAKSSRPHPKLPGTIHETASEIEQAGGRALAVKVDVRDEQQIADAVAAAIDQFGGIDILVNNASAIYLANTLETPLKRVDLMFGVNVRGTLACSQACLPHLLDAKNGKILNLAPPPNLDPRWFRDHGAYTIAKYGMSLCVIGMSAEFADQGLSVSALWPRTVIATDAINMLGGKISADACRTPQIVADAAHVILSESGQLYNGKFLIDEYLLRAVGVEDFDRYAVKPGAPLAIDLFLDEARSR